MGKLGKTVERNDMGNLEDRIDDLEKRVNAFCRDTVSSEKEVHYGEQTSGSFEKPEPMDKSCEHDKGEFWTENEESCYCNMKKEFPTCPFCKKEESLEEVLEKVREKWNKICSEGGDSFTSCVTLEERQAQAISKWIESRLPEKFNEGGSSKYSQGWNKCIGATKERLGIK